MYWETDTLWCIIETLIYESFQMLFLPPCIKPEKFESVPTQASSELQSANLGLLQVAVGEVRDTLMNPSPTQSQSVTNV